MTDDYRAEDERPDDPSASRFYPLEATTHIVYENGRWVLMLNVTAWEPNSDEHPVRNHWKRINDYNTEQEAKVAAQWIARSANRRIRPPTGF